MRRKRTEQTNSYPFARSVSPELLVREEPDEEEDEEEDDGDRDDDDDTTDAGYSE